MRNLKSFPPNQFGVKPFLTWTKQWKRNEREHWEIENLI